MITVDDRKVRLPWWGVLCVILGTILLTGLFDYLGKLSLARPALVSVAIVSIAIALRWKLKRHTWFWITMIVLAALHIPLVLFIPWTTKWVPAIVTIPIGMADLYIMLWRLSVIGSWMKSPTMS